MLHCKRRHTKSWNRRWDCKDFWFNSLGGFVQYLHLLTRCSHTQTHTHTQRHGYCTSKNDAGVRLRLTAVEYYPLSEVAAYLQEWHTVVEAQPANCMETMQHVEWYFFTCSVSIASLRGLRLTAGWWTESSVPGPHEWGHLVNLNIEPWIVSISCNVTDVTSLQWVLE